MGRAPKAASEPALETHYYAAGEGPAKVPNAKKNLYIGYCPNKEMVWRQPSDQKKGAKKDLYICVF